jgi:uncharacterized protein (DUF302 family)
MGKNAYQNIRTQVKKNLKPLIVDRFGIEYAIRAEMNLPAAEAERALRRGLNEKNFHVIHETDVKGIHNHYEIEYPEFKIFKTVESEQFMGCRHCNTATKNNPTSSSILPPGMILYETDGVTRVSAVRPSTLLAVFRDGEIRDTVVEVESIFWDILDGLPNSRMLSPEPPLRLGESSGRRRLKNFLNLVASLADAEFSIHVTSPRPPEEVKASVKDALDRRGQKVLGEVAGGRIMLAVNPGQAHKALAIDPDVGVFAPLSVSVTREEGRTHVRTVRPTTLLIFFDQPAMQDILMEMEMLMWNGIVSGVPEARVESRQPPLQPEGGQRTTAGGLPGGLGAAEGD